MKNKMYRFLMVSVAAIFIAASLVGCTKKESEGVTIRFVQMEYDNTVVPYLEEVALKFEKENPNINVEILSLDWEHGHDTYTTWIKGGQTPDAANIAARWIPEFTSLDALEPLDPYLSKELLDNIPEYFQNSGYFRGTRYALPYTMDSRLIWYRTDLFEKAGVPLPKDGWTWEEFEQAAIKTNDPDNNIYGYAFMAGDVYFFDVFSTFLWCAGGDYWDKEGNIIVNNDEGLKALTFLNKLVNEDKVAQPGLIANAQFEVDQMFINGNASMIYTGAWLIPMIAETNPNLQHGVVSFPKDKKSVNLAGNDILVMFKNSAHKEETMKFLEFQYRDDIRKGFLSGRGMIPYTYSLLEDPEFSGPIWGAFNDAAQYATPQPMTLTTNALMEEVMKMGQSVFLGKATPQEALDKLAKSMETLDKP